MMMIIFVVVVFDGEKATTAVAEIEKAVWIGGNLLAEGRSEARAGLVTRRPLPAAALPTAPL